MDLSKKSALYFVILFGVISLFADMTYEAGRSITGPYLAVLGADAAIVGFVSGLAEFLGYGLRFFSGLWADKTHRYWAFTITGYACNVLAVPLIGLAGHWWVAASLIVMERVGKAVRVPSRDAMLSYAGEQLGAGKAFGLHEALDQIGGMMGPLIIAVILYFKGSYQHAFLALFIPAFLTIAVLFIARSFYPQPTQLVVKSYVVTKNADQMRKAFWWYVAASALVAAGYADFPLIAYHFQKKALLSPVWMPSLYAFAMGISIITAPLFGWIYDKKGFSIVIFTTAIAAFFAPCVFLGGTQWIVAGILLWGIGISAQDSLMRAVIARLTEKNTIASAYGIFHLFFGLFWFLGSALMGVLYDISLISLVIFSMTCQFAALPLLLFVRNS